MVADDLLVGADHRDASLEARMDKSPADPGAGSEVDGDVGLAAAEACQVGGERRGWGDPPPFSRVANEDRDDFKMLLELEPLGKRLADGSIASKRDPERRRRVPLRRFRRHLPRGQILHLERGRQLPHEPLPEPGRALYLFQSE